MDYMSARSFGVEMLRIGRSRWEHLEAKALGDKSMVRHLLSVERRNKVRTVNAGVIGKG